MILRFTLERELGGGEWQEAISDGYQSVLERMGENSQEVWLF